MAGIFFDARYIRPGFHDGISRFSANLFAALARSVEVTAIISDEAQLKQLPNATRWVKINAPTSVLEPLASLRLNKYQPDVVFSPMQTIGSFGRRFKLILTIHDLIYYRHPKPPAALPWHIRLGWRLFHLTFIPERLLLAGCTAVVAVSETTAREIRSNRLTKKRVAVVHNAPERVLALPTKRRATKSLVYMGTFMPYKNVETLISGMAHLPDYRLELLSRITPSRKAELEKLAEREGATVHFHNGVSDERYRELLAKAKALVSASLEEGFGIPLVEAMEQGVPVVISDIEIFREVAGEVGFYFEPKNPQAFAEQVRRLEKRTVAANQLRNQSAKFNWDASAAELLNLIRSI